MAALNQRPSTRSRVFAIACSLPQAKNDLLFLPLPNYNPLRLVLGLEGSPTENPLSALLTNAELLIGLEILS